MKLTTAALLSASIYAAFFQSAAPLHAVNRELVESLGKGAFPTAGTVNLLPANAFTFSQANPVFTQSLLTYSFNQVVAGSVLWGGSITTTAGYDFGTTGFEFVQAGSGTLTLSGSNTYTGATTLTSGTLTLDAGYTQTGAITILSGTLINNSSNVVTVNGTTLQPGGTFTAGSTSAGSVLSVDGAVISGTTSTPETKKKNRAKQSVLIDFPRIAQAGVTGRLFYLIFGNTEFYPTARFALENGKYGPEITFQKTVFDDYFARTRRETGVVLTSNQTSVARALDRSSTDTRQENLVVALLSQFDDFLPYEFDQIAPEELSATFESAFANAEIHLQNVEDRLEAARAGVRGFSSTLSLADRDGKRVLDPKDGKSMQRDVFSPLPENKWGVWTSGSGEFVNIGDDSNATGYDLKTGGVTVGMDYRVNSNLIVGLAGSYAHTETDLPADGDLTVEGGRLAIYGTFYNGGAYVNGVVGGGYNQFDSHRAAFTGFANGRTYGREFDALLSGGYDWKTGPLAFGPTVSASYTATGLHHFREDGSLAPLAVESQTEERLRTRVGGHAVIEFKVGAVKLRPEARAEWQHDYLDASRGVSAGFANGAGDLFTVQGPELGSDAAILSLGLTVEWSPTWLTYVNYEAELGRENYERQTLNLGVQWSF